MTRQKLHATPTWHLRQTEPGGYSRPNEEPQKACPLAERQVSSSVGQGTRADPLPQGRIGGMLLIVSCKWSKHIKDWWKDPSGSGVMSSVTIQAMSQDITIFGTYWPFIRKGAQTSDSAGSLWTQLQTAYLTPNGIQETHESTLKIN